MVEGTSASEIDRSRIVGVGSYEGVSQAEIRTKTGEFHRTAAGGTYILEDYIEGISFSNKYI